MTSFIQDSIQKRSSEISSVYIHYPFCRHLCNYCDFHKRIINSNDLVKYYNYLKNCFVGHHKLMSERSFIWSSLESLYLGGGTPSLLKPAGIKYLLNLFKEFGISFDQNMEFTMELNPGSWDRDDLDHYHEQGINRYSVGLQSLEDKFLRALDRIHSLEDIHLTLSELSKRKHNFSVDFMIGLPFSVSGKRDVCREIQSVLKYKPNHFSVYVLTTKPNYVHYKDLPCDNYVEDEYFLVSELLKNSGHEHYEVSNFSLPGKESVHNMKYWNTQSVAAFGPSATGLLIDSSKAIRYKWKTNRAEFVREKLNLSEIYLEELYLGLRTRRGINYKGFFAKDYDIKKIDILLKSWCDRKLAIIENQRVRLTTKGFLILDFLMDEIFLCCKTL